MTKSELVKDIIIVLNFVRQNPEYRGKISKVFKAYHLNWYLSDTLMSNVLMRRNKDMLYKIHYDFVEAIY